MCLFCVEVQQEKLNSKQLSKLFFELLISGDEKHLDELDQIVGNLSEEYKQTLNKEANDEILLDDPDPFDTF